MINELQAGLSCYFFGQRDPITLSAIKKLFRAVRGAQNSPSKNLFAVSREPLGEALWSAISFQFDRTPTFFPSSKSVVDRVTGYLLLIEYRNHVAIFKSQIDLSQEFIKRHLKKLNPREVDRGLTTKSSVFDRVRLRHMSLSRFALRSKTLEGPDLQNNVGMTSSSRFAPLGYSFREEEEHFSTTPRTGRISKRADRAGYLGLVEYAQNIIDRIHPRPGRPSESPFLAAFARPMELSELSSPPCQFAVDTAILRQAIFDDKVIRLVKFDNGNFRELAQTEVDGVLEELTEALEVKKNAKGKLILSQPSSGLEIGEIAINKSRIGLRHLNLPSLSKIRVESTQFDLGTDDNITSLKQFIDKQDTFIILFGEPQLAYLDGNLYQDDSLKNGGALFLGYLFGNNELKNVKDEKGTFTSNHKTFDSNSTFGTILSSAASDDDALVCDDLGDEWADFIGFRTNTSSPRITFYHAKHGDLSLGASPFHISVSQAIKNLGNLSLPASSMPTKFAKWGRLYKNEKVVTKIPRTCRGTLLDVETSVEFCRNAPHTTKRVAIVTSSLSKAAVKKMFEDIQAGATVDPYFVQLYWLLSSFFAACSEVGAFGCVICRE